jgi:glycopeptide antibiotics resistance protein
VRAFGYVLLGLIVYGSFYPFIGGADAVRRLPLLFDIGHLILSDIIENMLAFVPMGVAFALTPDRQIRRRDFITAIVVAFLLQIGQLWMPHRQPAISDAVFNILGLLLGAGVAIAVRLLGTDSRSMSPVGLALVSLFFFHVGLTVLAWMGLAGQFEKYRLLVEWQQSRPMLPWLTWLAGGVAMVPLLRPKLRQWARVAAGLIICTLLWTGLTPVHPVPQSFNWIPFKSLIFGFSWGLAASLAWKLFAYATLTRLLMLSRVRAQAAVPMVVLLVLLLELAQTRLGSGTPDISEPILALLCAWSIVQEVRIHAQRVEGGRRTGLRHFR